MRRMMRKIRNVAIAAKKGIRLGRFANNLPEGNFINIVDHTEEESISSSHLKKVVDAIQIQIDRDFLPKWGDTVIIPRENAPHLLVKMPTKLRISDELITPFVELGDTFPREHPVNGAFGLHDATVKIQGNTAVASIFGFVDIAKIIKRNQDWSITLSHEILEILADPIPDSHPISDLDIPENGLFHFITCKHLFGPDIEYLVEPCDPVHILNYKINGIRVSDFVFPSYYSCGSSPFDAMRMISNPGQLAPVGYYSFRKVSRSGKGPLTSTLFEKKDTKNGIKVVPTSGDAPHLIGVRAIPRWFIKRKNMRRYMNG